MTRETAIGQQLERIGRTAKEAKEAADRAAKAVGRQAAVLADLAKQVRTLAGEEAEPKRRMSWFLVGTEDGPDAGELMADLLGWIDRVLVYYPRAAKTLEQSCWPWHPAVVEELLCLAATWEQATKQGGRAMSEWHDRYLPGVITRLRDGDLKGCALGMHTPANYRSPWLPDELSGDADAVAEWWTRAAGKAAPPVPSPGLRAETKAKLSD